MHHEIFLHVVWTTRNRAPLIDAGRAAWLQRELPGIARQERAQLLAIGIVSTHLHLLLRVHPSTTIPRLLQRLKGGSAHGINRGTACRPNDLRWAKGYAVRSVGPRELERVIGYIRRQPEHHPGEAIDGRPSPEPATSTILPRTDPVASATLAAPASPAGPAEPRLQP